MQIRTVQKQDYEAIIKLLKLNTPLYFAKEEEKDLRYYLENHAENFFVIELEKEILECGGFNFSDDFKVGKLSWDIFHPQYHGKGFGTLLTHFRINKLKHIPPLKLFLLGPPNWFIHFMRNSVLKPKKLLKIFGLLVLICIEWSFHSKNLY